MRLRKSKYWKIWSTSKDLWSENQSNLWAWRKNGGSLEAKSNTARRSK